MTRGAAVVVAVVCLAAGYYWRKWLQAEEDATGARQKAEAAGKAAWKARGVMAAVILVLLVAADMWIKGKGR